MLSSKFKKRFWCVQLTIGISSIADLLGLAAFIPVLGTLTDPTMLERGNLLGNLKVYTGIADNQKFILLLFVLAVLFFVLRMGVILLANYIQNKFIFDLNKWLGESMYNYFLNTTFEEFKRKSTSEVVRELTTNTQHFSKFLVMPLLLLTTEILVLLMVVVGILIYNAEVFLLLVFTLFPVAYLFNRSIKSKVRKYGEEQNRLTPILYDQAVRGVAGYVDVKLRGKEKSLVSDYRGTLTSLNRISVITALLNLVPSKLFELVTVSGLLVLYTYCVYWAKDSSQVLPLILLYAAAGYRLIPSLSRVVPSIMQLEQFQYLFTIFTKSKLTEPSINVVKSDRELTFSEAIRVEKLSFKYENGREVFKNLNLKINKGEIVGLIGKSGSGKTTLVKLLLGFLTANSGRIFIDEEYLTEENKVAWRKKISYVEQSPYLEKGSLAKNIAFLDNKVDEGRLLQAIEAASLSEVIANSDPYEFLISENGANLSGGQKQRVAIARALYHDADLIVLDEATSALDNYTENEIVETVNKLSNTGVTILIIAHRKTSLRPVDYVLELKDKSVKKNGVEDPMRRN